MSETQGGEGESDHEVDPTVTQADTQIEVPPPAAGERLDDSDESVVYVNSDDEDEDSGELGPRNPTEKLEAQASELEDAYDCLRIRTPLEELETYAQARLETLVRLGEAERAQLTSEAITAGLGALRHVMGAAQPRES